MIGRRDLLIGAGCAAALGAGEWFRPRRALRLLPGGEKLGDVVPSHFGDWELGEIGEVVIPQTPGSLASRLYSETLARQYHRGGARPAEVMLLIAYGEAQSDLLQLHRPESCYPAIGFRIVDRKLLNLPVAAGVSIPAVALTAQAGTRVERILYWTRLGEALPQTAAEQRADRFSAALAGYVGDGALIRVSTLVPPDGGSDAALADFMRAMIRGVAPGNRRALIGTERARALGTLVA